MTRRGCMRVEISFVGCLGATRGCHLVLPRVGPLRAVGGCKTFETRYLSGFKKIKSTFTWNLDSQPLARRCTLASRRIRSRRSPHFRGGGGRLL